VTQHSHSPAANNYSNSNYPPYSYTSNHPPPPPPPPPPLPLIISVTEARTPSSIMSSPSLASSVMPILHHHDNDSNDKNNQSMVSMKSFSVPKQVTLSWTSLTIKARSKSYLDLPMAIFRKKLKRKRNEIILNKIHGMVEPGHLLALMGPR
jgi:hypothetical protein